MKKRLAISFLFPLLVYAMENGLSIDAVGKQLDIIHTVHDKQKSPAEKMNSIHAKLACYLKQRKDKGCNMSYYKGLAAILNDAACERLERENKGTNLRDYWSDGKKYEQSVIMKVFKA